MQNVTRIDVVDKVTGRAMYAADLTFDDMLYARTVRIGSVAHARIDSIDTSGAVALPGVVGIYTAADIGGVNCTQFNKPALAADIIRSEGDGIAVVAAETDDIARHAAALVRTAYTPLPAVFDPEAALSPDAPRVYDSGNEACSHELVKGDVSRGFELADVIFERRFTTQRIHHSAIEPDVAVAVPEYGGLTVYAPCKAPYNVRNTVAQTLGLAPELVRLIQPEIGGMFGGKDSDTVLCACRAGLVALMTGRPCKLVWDREECMREGTKRHPFILDYKLGATRDGRITALEIAGTVDVGAYLSRSLHTVWRATVEAAGPYEIPNVHTKITGVYTNNVFSDAVRGFGSPQVDFASESMMNELASMLGVTPLEIRRKNILREGSIAATGQKLTCVSLSECLDKLETVFDTNAVSPARPGCVRGRGIACLYRGESYGAANPGSDYCGLSLCLCPNGSVIVKSSISEVGQGSHTVEVKVVSDILGIPAESICIERVDTSRVPDSGVTAGSRGTMSCGSAALIAANELIRRIADFCGIASDCATFRDGVIYCGGKRVASFAQAASDYCAAGCDPIVDTLYKAPQTSWDFDKKCGNTYNTYSYGAAGAEVEIDLTSGKVFVTDFTCLHDIGNIINHEEASAQMAGGAIMALGYTLTEEVLSHDGRVSNANFDEYLIPTAADIGKLTAMPLAIKRADNPLGVHGVGEASTALVAPAVAAAIYDALHVHIRSLPVTLERMRSAIDTAKEAKI